MEHTGQTLGYYILQWRIEVADIPVQQWIRLQEFRLQWRVLPTLHPTRTLHRKSNLCRMGGKELEVVRRYWTHHPGLACLRRHRRYEKLLRSRPDNLDLQCWDLFIRCCSHVQLHKRFIYLGKTNTRFPQLYCEFLYSIRQLNEYHVRTSLRNGRDM